MCACYVFLTPCWARQAPEATIQSRTVGKAGGFLTLLGMLSKLRFLPEPHTDYLQSVSRREFRFLAAPGLSSVFTVLKLRLTLALRWTDAPSRSRQGRDLVSDVRDTGMSAA